MALCCMPCVGGAHTLLRSGASFPLSIGSIDKCSAFSCITTSIWSINVKKYHFRRHRRGVPLPLQVNLRRATRSSQKPWICIPAASLAQSSCSSVTSVERSSGSLLSSYKPPVLSGEDEDADGGKAYNSSSDVDSREQLRRDRIAQANKGKVPWNKGIHHSPETIAKIRERTKKAMLNPEIRDKLRQCGMNQTSETKAKIRKKMVGYWEGKRICNKVQALCVKEWKRAIAEAARLGGPGDEEFEWDSYKIIKKQYKLEELKAERRDRDPLRASLKLQRKRKTVSDAHRKSISDAIREKWADPEYQARVSAGMAKAEADKRRKKIPLGTSKKKVTSDKLPTSTEATVATVEEASAEKKKPLPAVPVDEDFIAEVLAEEVTLKTKSERSTAARIKGPQKVTLVRLEDHNLSFGEDDEAAGQVVTVAVERPLVEADVRTPSAGPEVVQLRSKLSSKSCNDIFVLERVQRIQQLQKGRLEVELKRKEAADRARMLIASAERAASALERSGNADAATLATLREARRVLAEASRSVQAGELKPGSSFHTSISPGSAKSKENGKAASGSRSGNFHLRTWTEGDSIEDCPHPIPIRMVKVPSWEEHELDGVSRKSSSIRSSGWTASEPDTAKEHVLEEDAAGQATDSEGHDKEAAHNEEYHTAAEGADGQRPSKNGSSGSKKRWHRGRLVVMNEDERT